MNRGIHDRGTEGEEMIIESMKKGLVMKVMMTTMMMMRGQEGKEGTFLDVGEG